MKAIIIDEESFKRLFDEFAKDLDLGGREAVDEVPEFQRRDAKSAVDSARRKWTYAFRTLQQNLERAR